MCLMKDEAHCVLIFYIPLSLVSESTPAHKLSSEKCDTWQVNMYSALTDCGTELFFSHRVILKPCGLKKNPWNGPSTPEKNIVLSKHPVFRTALTSARLCRDKLCPAVRGHGRHVEKSLLRTGVTPSPCCQETPWADYSLFGRDRRHLFERDSLCLSLVVSSLSHRCFGYCCSMTKHPGELCYCTHIHIYVDGTAHIYIDDVFFIIHCFFSGWSGLVGQFLLNFLFI